MVAAGGAFAETPSSQIAPEPEAQLQATQADGALGSQPATELETALETPGVRCPYSPSCTPFNLEPCEQYCGPGFGVCYRFCCVCSG